MRHKHTGRECIQRRVWAWILELQNGLPPCYDFRTRREIGIAWCYLHQKHVDGASETIKGVK